jgi:hypothetical protein
LTSPETKPRRTAAILPSSMAAAISSPTRGATMVTRAPALCSSRSRRAAASPPPTIRAGRSLRSKNAGK